MRAEMGQNRLSGQTLRAAEIEPRPVELDLSASCSFGDVRFPKVADI